MTATTALKFDNTKPEMRRDLALYRARPALRLLEANGKLELLSSGRTILVDGESLRRLMGQSPANSETPAETAPLI